jgi:GntR family galactonate operon transcriptional repressor
MKATHVAALVRALPNAMMRRTHRPGSPPPPMDYRQPSDRKSMHSRIVQEIGMQIVSGRFLPDDKLPAEVLLCEEYAVSRPVLREATRVLVAKGLVYSRPRVGTVVKPRREWHMLDPDVLHWLMQSSPQNEFFALLTTVRSIIEPAAAALAAQHANPADIAAIQEAYGRMEGARSVEDILQPDLDFHSIADATHNDLLANLCNMLSLALREALKHSNQRPNLHELALPRHKAILTAIENRDALGAQHATLVQLDDARNALSVVLGGGSY